MRFLKIPELSEKDKERFFSYIDKTGDCWVWTGSCNHDGYGQFKNGEIYSSIAKDFNVHLETVRQVAIANGVRRYEKKKN